MRVIELPQGRKRKITSGTREWADYNVNCMKGCSNNCRYCYAKVIAKRFKRCTEETWQNMEINNSALTRSFRKYNGRVMFPSSHDIIDIPEIKEACFVVMKKLLEVNNELLITTKPKLSITKDIIERFQSFKEHLQFRFTITSLNNQLLSFWEPNAPTFEERFEALKYAHENDFKTSVSIEPFLDKTPQTLIDILSPYITESIWLGPMNYIPLNGIPDIDGFHYEEVRANYLTEHLREIYEELKDNPIIRFKDSMNNRLGIKDL